LGVVLVLARWSFQNANLQHQHNLPFKIQTAGIFYFLILGLKSEMFFINFQNALVKGSEVIKRMTGDVVYYQCQT